MCIDSAYARKSKCVKSDDVMLRHSMDTLPLAALFVTFLVFSPKFGKVAGTYDLLFFMDTGRSEVVGTLISNLLQSNSFELFALNGGGGCKYILYSSLFKGICLFTGAGRGGRLWSHVPSNYLLS